MFLQPWRLERAPLPGPAVEEGISTVCDFTVCLESTDFIFVGCETLLSGEQRNATIDDGYYTGGDRGGAGGRAHQSHQLPVRGGYLSNQAGIRVIRRVSERNNKRKRKDRVSRRVDSSSDSMTVFRLIQEKFLIFSPEKGEHRSSKSFKNLLNCSIWN